MLNQEQYRLFNNLNEVNILEQDIWDYEPEVLRNLLIDRTRSSKTRKETRDPARIVNIFWATSNYSDSVRDTDGNTVEEGFQYDDEIKAENLTGRFQNIVIPRVLKNKTLQKSRTKDRAEVFTPSWICNAQNNLVDDARFGRKEVFNREYMDEEGKHSWTPSEGRIEFPEGKTWEDYVSENCIEITCGEAPYLVSRYDTTTGELIPVFSRIGLLDRKMRIVNENVGSEEEWYRMAERAFKHTYGYEWQGDSLLLAREAFLMTYIEYFVDRFNEKDGNGEYARNSDGQLNVPSKSSLISVSEIISWNLWQMDGIRMVVPDSCHETVQVSRQRDLFSDNVKTDVWPCPGCAKNDVHLHNGDYCIIRDWDRQKPENWSPEKADSESWMEIEFASLTSSHKI